MGWRALKTYQVANEDRQILDLFDADRAAAFSVRADGILFDYSKTSLDITARDMLLELIDETGLTERRKAMFSGEKINETEDREVLHTALRNLDGGPVKVDDNDVMPGVLNTLDRMAKFAEGIRSGAIHPGGGGRFTDVVNIGIGGSDLGPAMATLALAPYHDGPSCHFVSNVDGAHIHDVLAGLDPVSTLVIIASKTFSTIETMTNATHARNWLAKRIGADQVGGHMAAVSSDLVKTTAYGIDSDRVFGFEDWVGGRYSLWGPIGLSLMIAIGDENFRDFLRGAQAMDRHFQTAPLAQNMPVMLAAVGLWHNQVCGYASRAVLPYDQRLSRLPAYFQQLEMESNGKRVAMDGSDLSIDSGPIVWGEPGTNGQHAFYQLIHQGTRVVPCDFMLAAQGHEPDLADQHRLLAANCLAQSEALLKGRSLDEAREIMATKGFEGDALERQARHRVFPGNRPSTTLLYPKLTPFVLGQIIALYEHRVFVEGVVFGINSFDQWGVELGKELAVALEPVVGGQESAAGKDGSTQMLVAFLQSI
ncbi:MAG: glucose-6-phosphate isomerase [Marinosulfonomonas sp.]|nr:glucose-6-phosphate isomerase [Marinosulfonomonas sp.]